MSLPMKGAADVKDLWKSSEKTLINLLTDILILLLEYPRPELDFPLDFKTAGSYSNILFNSVFFYSDRCNSSRA